MGWQREKYSVGLDCVTVSLWSWSLAGLSLCTDWCSNRRSWLRFSAYFKGKLRF